MIIICKTAGRVDLKTRYIEPVSVTVTDRTLKSKAFVRKARIKRDITLVTIVNEEVLQMHSLDSRRCFLV